MTARLCSPDQLFAWLVDVATSGEVLFPQLGQDGALRFEPVDDTSVLGFEGYHPTQLPPGKIFSPAQDPLFSFRAGSEGGFEVEPHFDRTSRVIAGVRPCDLKGIGLMDKVQAEDDEDPHYFARRRAAVLVAYACSRPCDERCFCEAAGSLDHREGADVVLTPVGDSLLAEAITAAGASLLESLQGDVCDDPEAQRARYLAERPSPFGRQLDAAPALVGEALGRTWDAAVWLKNAEACFTCGTCTVVCPTCYCFDTRDEVSLAEPGSGTRYRTWHGCMLPDFAVVAGGHDFRPALSAKHRHRVKRKFEYLPGRFPDDGAFCVGCGRCGTQCTAGIDIFHMANAVVAEEGR